MKTTKLAAVATLLISCLGCQSEPTTPREEAEQAQENLESARERAAEIVAESEEEAVDIIADAREEAAAEVRDAKETAETMVQDAEEELTVKLNDLSEPNLERNREEVKGVEDIQPGVPTSE
ncbi:secreted protein [Rhodopirellula maiorica SM1]|uniref:Secreted protein n=1 Tax=Rhodopirellula maiorica SM1 TaxID=1265738 RepID=M5REC5_9BACT|nr:hypothetical protein [Rhodopirellula maiorica]EMI17441.1 secreted protein [Rhodopirellula maiorica SM1]